MFNFFDNANKKSDLPDDDATAEMLRQLRTYLSQQFPGCDFEMYTLKQPSAKPGAKPAPFAPSWTGGKVSPLAPLPEIGQADLFELEAEVSARQQAAIDALHSLTQAQAELIAALKAELA